MPTAVHKGEKKNNVNNLVGGQRCSVPALQCGRDVYKGEKKNVDHASKFHVEEFEKNIDQEISTNESRNTYNDVDFENADNLPRQTKYIDRYNEDLLLLEGNPRKNAN